MILHWDLSQGKSVGKLIRKPLRLHSCWPAGTLEWQSKDSCNAHFGSRQRVCCWPTPGQNPTTTPLKFLTNLYLQTCPLKFQICPFILFLPSLIGETNCKQTRHCHFCLEFSFSLLGIPGQILSDLSLSFTLYSPSPQFWYHQHALIFVFLVKFVSSLIITLYSRNVCGEFKMNSMVNLSFHIISHDLRPCACNGEGSFFSSFC